MKAHISYIFSASLAITAAAGLAGCIENDLPYPRIQQNITAISAAGESAPARIDTATLTATIFLEETTDIRAVEFAKFEYTPEANSDKDLTQGTWDLSVPLTVDLSRWQSYQWLVRAEQDIERYFSIAGQIGETILDAVGRRIIVNVPENANLRALEITAIKLGPKEISTLMPDYHAGSVIDLSAPRRVEVTAWGRTEDWTIYAQRTAQVVATSSADAWSRVIWVYGEGPADADNYFEYKEEGAGTWTSVDRADITRKEGAFSCCIKHLKPLTSYTVRSRSGDNIGNELTVRTKPLKCFPTETSTSGGKTERYGAHGMRTANAFGTPATRAPRLLAKPM